MDSKLFLHRVRSRDTDAASSAQAGARFLAAADMQRLRHLEFSTARRVRGTFSGRHSSRQRGQSVEFNDYRQYIPGDDPADVDWKVYGRSDRLFIKLYEHESELTTTILVDGSASMAFRGCSAPATGVKVFGARGKRVVHEARSKFDVAGSVAAALAFLLVQRNDRVALGVACSGLTSYEGPGVSMLHLQRLLGAMDRHAPTGSARLPEAIDGIVRRSRRRGILVVVSDFLDDIDPTIAALAHAGARGHEIVLFQILHEEELNLPRGGNGLFIDAESSEQVRVHLDDIRVEYELGMAKFLDRMKRVSTGLGMDRTLLHTGEDHCAVLQRYLLRRSVGGGTRRG